MSDKMETPEEIARKILQECGVSCVQSSPCDACKMFGLIRDCIQAERERAQRLGEK